MIAMRYSQELIIDITICFNGAVERSRTSDLLIKNSKMHCFTLF